MQLTVPDLVKMFDVSEATVRRWVKQQELPAQQVGGQFRFNHAEVLEWATAHQLRLPAELFEFKESEGSLTVNLVDALEAGGIVWNVEARDKRSVLQAVVGALPLSNEVDRELLLRLFLAREALASTAVGGGIALPHVRNPIVLHVRRPQMTLCFLKTPVDFGALDGKPVEVLFSLISPTARLHLQLISRLSYALHDADFRQVLARRAGRDKILKALRRIEASLSGSAGARKAAS